VPRAKRFDYWADVLSQVLIPMSVECNDADNLSEDLTFAPMGALSIIRNSGGPHSTRRGPRELRRSQDRCYHLLVSLSGSWRLTHCGRSALRPGDVILTDSQFQHRVDITCNYGIINLKLPVNWLNTWLPEPAALVGRCIYGDSPQGQPLSRFITQLSPEFATTSGLPHSMLADQVGALLALNVDSAFDLPHVDRALRGRILDCIRQRCAEPGLEAGDVAASLNLTSHDVHRALAARGETFAVALFAARTISTRARAMHPLAQGHPTTIYRRHA
jgi:hypothetical protein